MILVVVNVIWLCSPVRSSGEGSSSDLTVSYSVEVTSKKGGNMGIGETYNGGVETFFTNAQHARLRLVSLMRIQSIYASLNDTGSFTIVKESGKNKYVTRLNRQEWKAYNSKYKDAICKLTEDTTQVLRYVCKKATITLKDGKVITAWYTTDMKAPLFSSLEPAFSQVPGMVLKFEYTYRKKTIRYTATSVSHRPLSDEVLLTP